MLFHLNRFYVNMVFEDSVDGIHFINGCNNTSATTVKTLGPIINHVSYDINLFHLTILRDTNTRYFEIAEVTCEQVKALF